MFSLKIVAVKNRENLGQESAIIGVEKSSSRTGVNISVLEIRGVVPKLSKSLAGTAVSS